MELGAFRMELGACAIDLLMMTGCCQDRARAGVSCDLERVEKSFELVVECEVMLLMT